MATKARLLHNPRCTKSREALNYLNDKGIQIEIVEYLKDGITVDQLLEFIKSTGLYPKDVLRTNEAEFKEHFKGKDLSENELLKLMVKYPKVIQRPIVIVNNKGVIARPLELIDQII